jgi:hypothetical protein
VSSYDDALLNVALDYADSPIAPLTEVEIFTGSIFNKSGVQTRRQRDKSSKLKDQFDRIAKQTESRILKKNTGTIRDDFSDDEDYIPSSHSGPSALELSVACLHASMVKTKKTKGSRFPGDCQSFKVVAAHCALREISYANRQADIARGARLFANRSATAARRA